MKDNLFEMLLHLFEKSLTQLHKGYKLEPDTQEEINKDELLATDNAGLFIKSAQHNSTRIFTYDEQMKLTKASYQFLMKMKLWHILDTELFETVLDHLYFSESRVVTLQETKWTIRNVLATHLDDKQLTFLDLILYQTEDELTTH